MIVDPDFLDHWKTRLLVDTLGGDELAPLYVLRIWAHCQQRRKSEAITISAAGLRSLCRCSSSVISAERLEAALIQAGFITRDGDDIRAVDWAARNVKLITAWKNGKAGGDAKAANAAQRLANGYPNATEPLPNDETALPIRSRSRSRSREEKNKDKSKGKDNAARPAPRATPAKALLLAEGVDEQTADDWLLHRRAKRATASATVIEDRKRVCAIAGVALAEGLRLEISRGWQGLQAEWITNATTTRAPPGLPFQTANDKARDWANGLFQGIDDDRNIIDITPAAIPRIG